MKNAINNLTRWFQKSIVNLWGNGKPTKLSRNAKERYDSMAKEKVPNYTDADIAEIKAAAEAAGGKLNAVETRVLAEKLGKTEKSLRSKLVSMKDDATGEHLYKSEAKSVATASKADDGPTKKELLRELAEFGVDPKAFEGATKDGVRVVIGFAKRAAEKVAEAA